MCKPEAFITKTRKARKKHRCCECGVTINPGDRYQYSSGIWDGEPDSYKQCQTCYQVFEWAAGQAEYNDEVPLFGSLRDWLVDLQVSGQSKEDWLNYIAQRNFVENGKLRRLLKVPG